jgi:hypothetical protein
LLLRSLAAALALASLGCDVNHAPPVPPIERAFQYRGATLKLSAPELAALSATGATRLYLRLFDVDWPTGAPAPLPAAPLRLLEGVRMPDKLEIVPVIVLPEAIFRRLDEAGVALLAAKVWAQVRGQLPAIRTASTPPLRELQLDCDWTGASRAGYFAFAKALGHLVRPAGVALSATLRLHQVKYRERTGVPPVERGMLLFFGMGNAQPADGPPEADRAIFDPSIASGYLERLQAYPLPVDLALPILSWTVHRRGGEPIAILQGTDPAELSALPYLEPGAPAGPGAPARFHVTQKSILHGVQLQYDDILVGDVIDPRTALQAAELVAPRLPARGAGSRRAVALFDLSEGSVQRHDPEQSLERIFRAVH